MRCGRGGCRYPRGHGGPCEPPIQQGPTIFVSDDEPTPEVELVEHGPRPFPWGALLWAFACGMIAGWAVFR